MVRKKIEFINDKILILPSMEVRDVIDLEDYSEYFLSAQFKVDYKKIVYSITNAFTRSNIPQSTLACDAVHVHESLNVRSELDPHG